MLGKNANTKRGNLAGKQWIEGPSLSLWFFRECAFVHVHKSKSDLSDICSLTFFSMITFIGIFESYSSLKRESCYIPPQFTLTFVRLDLRCIGRIYLLSYYWPTGTGIVEKEGKLKKKKKKGTQTWEFEGHPPPAFLSLLSHGTTVIHFLKLSIWGMDCKEIKCGQDREEESKLPPLCRQPWYMLTQVQFTGSMVLHLLTQVLLELLNTCTFKGHTTSGLNRMKFYSDLDEIFWRSINY